MENLRRLYISQDEGQGITKRLENAISQMIKAGLAPAGSSLPPQREIAEALEISLSVVTRAFNNLKRAGILYGERGRGSFVAESEQFAHDHGDRFFRDDDCLTGEKFSEPPDSPILCNLVERLDFMNTQLPEIIDFKKIAASKESLKEYGAEYLRFLGIRLKPEDVTISHNAYLALWVAFQIGCPPGCVLGAPDISFLPLFRNRLVAGNVDLIPIQSDEYGILPEALESACRNHHLTALTVSPECELPTTKRMGRQRREEIAAIARKYDLTIIENNWLLPEREPEIAPLAAFAPERSILLEHGSKMLSCGNFCSFSYVPEQMRERFIYQRNIIAGPLPLLSRKLTAYWIDSGNMERDYKSKNQEIRQRNELAREILEPLPVKIHKYARFCWLPLEKGKKGQLIRHRLLKRGVLISSSEKYLIGSICPEEGLLIGIAHEPNLDRLEKALCMIRAEVMA